MTGNDGQRSDQDAPDAALAELLARFEAERPAFEAWLAELATQAASAQRELAALLEAERPAQEAWLAQLEADAPQREAELAALLADTPSLGDLWAQLEGDTGEDTGAARQR